MLFEQSDQPTLVLLTGATGFLGHYLLAELVKRGRACAVLLRPPLDDSLTRLTRLLDPLDIDITQRIAAGQIVPLQGDVNTSLPNGERIRIYSIVHCAACTQFITTSSGDPARHVRPPRGMGLMIGMDVVSPDGSPAPAMCDEYLEQLKDLGVLAGKTGLDRNVLTFLPPLVIADDEIEVLVHACGTISSRKPTDNSQCCWIASIAPTAPETCSVVRRASETEGEIRSRAGAPGRADSAHHAGPEESTRDFRDGVQLRVLSPAVRNFGAGCSRPR